MEPKQGTSAQFAPTRWSLITAAKASDGGADEALAELCNTYWYPVYAFLRRQGKSPHDAEDLTQGFFAHVIGRDNWLGKVDRTKGKFRSFLLACLQNYWSNERARESGPRRNPGTPLVALDAMEAEERYKLEPQDGADPAGLFERKWAESLVSRVLTGLEHDYEKRGSARLFHTLRPFLVGENEYGDSAALAAQLGMSAENTRTVTSRLRGEFRERLRREIEETVSGPQEVEEELRHLALLFRS